MPYRPEICRKDTVGGSDYENKIKKNTLFYGNGRPGNRDGLL
jgi:hypothetical protein